MRYIADSNGYVKEVSFGADIVCGGKSCTEYKGTVPSGYASLESWYIAEADKLYRWKISGGNLTLVSSAVAPVSSALPSYIKIYKTNDTTNYNTTYNYFDPFYGGTTIVLVRGEFSAGTYTFSSWGDRTDESIHGVYVGAGVNTVRISYSVRFLNNAESRTVLSGTLFRCRNGTSSRLATAQITQGYGRAFASNSTITSVQEGDFIYVQGYKGTASLKVDVIGSTDTQLVVEAIR